MASSSSPTSRSKLLIAVGGAVALALVIVVLAGRDPEQTGTATSAGEEPRVARAGSGSGESIAPADPGGAPTRSDMREETLPDGGHIQYFEGQGYAAVVEPGENASVPPPLSALPDNPSPPEAPPPELPQTARWKLGKTERIHEVLEHRVERLQRELTDARRDGDDDRVRRTEVLLARTRQRVEDLSRDMAQLREQAGSEPPEEEVIRQWEEETGRGVDQLHEGNRVDLPPPPSP